MSHQYYSFGYNTDGSSNYGNWTTPSTTATYTISSTDYLGDRNYMCRVYASDGTINSTTVEGSPYDDAAAVIKNAKVTFDATSNGGSLTGTATLYVQKGSSSVFTGVYSTNNGSVPTASKSGHTFNGWYTAKTGGYKVLNADGTLTGTAVSGYTTASAWAGTNDRTLYAQYTDDIPPDVTVKIYTGTTLISTCTSDCTASSIAKLDRGVKFVITASDPGSGIKNNQFTFAWNSPDQTYYNTTMVGSETDTLSNGSYTRTITSGGYRVMTLTFVDNSNNTKTIVIKVRVETTQYTITYNANGGSGAPDEQYKVHDSPITLSTTRPTKSGATFSTWNTKSDGTGTNYAPGATYSGNANLNLYAIYVNKPDVSFNDNFYVCPSDGDSTLSSGSDRNRDCHNGLYYNRMKITNTSYTKSTGKISFTVTLYMNDYAVSWQSGGNATVCIAKVGSSTCTTTITTYYFNTSSWLARGSSVSLGTFTVDVSGYTAGDYKIIARPNSGNKFSFSNTTYTNKKYFSVSW